MHAFSEIVTEIRNAFDAEFTPTDEAGKEKKKTDAILYLGYEKLSCEGKSAESGVL